MASNITTNDIPARQATPRSVGLQRARFRKYQSAKTAQGVFLSVALLLPIVSALVPSEYQRVIALIALISVLALLIDIAVVEPQRKRRMKEAAALQELFDCEVFQLPWRESLAGPKPEYEDIQDNASKPLSEKRESHLVPWYEPCVGNVPLHYGRLICQRANIYYDIRLRRAYKGYLFLGAVGLTTFLFLIGVAADLSFGSLVLSVFVPAAPILGWATRECGNQQETIGNLQQLKSAFEELWALALQRADEGVLTTGARELQDRIYQHRANNPLIFDWVYDLLRKQNEDGTRVAAEEFVARVQAILNQESAA